MSIGSGNPSEDGFYLIYFSKSPEIGQKLENSEIAKFEDGRWPEKYSDAWIHYWMHMPKI